MLLASLSESKQHMGGSDLGCALNALETHQTRPGNLVALNSKP